MKKALLFLVLLPSAVFAQDVQQQKKNEKQAILIKFEKLSMRNDNMTLTKDSPGDLEIAGDSIHVSGPVNVDMHGKKMKRQTAGNWILDGRGVLVSLACNPVSLKANRFNYDDKSKTGFLTGDIIAIENGSEKRIGQRAELDMNNNGYKIISIK